MDISADSLRDATPAVLPVISGARWFGPDTRPLVLRIEVPLTREQMVATLYGVAGPDEIASDEGLCGCVAVTLLIEGLSALETRAAALRADELSGTVESPEFLARCRQRVRELLSP